MTNKHLKQISALTDELDTIFIDYYEGVRESFITLNKELNDFHKEWEEANFDEEPIFDTTVVSNHLKTLSELAKQTHKKYIQLCEKYDTLSKAMQ